MDGGGFAVELDLGQLPGPFERPGVAGPGIRGRLAGPFPDRAAVPRLGLVEKSDGRGDPGRAKFSVITPPSTL